MNTEQIRKLWEAYVEVSEKKLDPVNDKENDKKFKDRKDKDIDNDGDVDSSDEYLHKRRAAVDNAIDARKEKEKDKKKVVGNDGEKKAEISKIGEAKMEDSEVLAAAKKLAANGKDEKAKKFGQGLVDFYKKNDGFTPDQVAGLQNIMKNAPFQLAKEEVELEEKVSPQDMQKIKGAVEAAGSSFMKIGAELKKAGLKHSFSTSPFPYYMVEPTRNNRVAIVNKKYADNPDFVIGPVAVGVMESLGLVNEAKMSVGDTVRIKDKAKNVADRKMLGKSGYIKSIRGSDILVKFVDGKSMIVDPQDLEMVKEDYLGESFEVLWRTIEEAVASEPKNRKGSATEPEAIDSKESPKSKEFIAKHKKSEKEYEDMPKDAAEKTTAAGRGVKSQAPARSGDNMKGDKKVVNPVKEDTRSERQKIMDILSGKTWNEIAEENLEEAVSKDKVDAKSVASMMRKDKVLKGFADKVEKMGKVSHQDLEKMLPDYVDGSAIAKLFK